MLLQNSFNAPLPLPIANGSVISPNSSPISILANYSCVDYDYGATINPMLPFVIYKSLGSNLQSTFYLPTAPTIGDMYTVMGTTVEISTVAYLIRTTNGLIGYSPQPFVWNTISPVVSSLDPDKPGNGLATITLMCVGYTGGQPIFTVLSTNGFPFEGFNTP